MGKDDIAHDDFFPYMTPTGDPQTDLDSPPILDDYATFH
jgi:hypothetical protein